MSLRRRSEPANAGPLIGVGLKPSRRQNIGFLKLASREQEICAKLVHIGIGTSKTFGFKDLSPKDKMEILL